ncbi:cobalamin B12-binding domain-containing protein [Streptomyces sp. NPDC098781]|uniref:cobalamin B12-binding domain-containing protein n=1 Tax=Streptomyces sp. NPDC098781 TaxID=3366097 RepID=UPI003805D5EE
MGNETPLTRLLARPSAPSGPAQEPPGLKQLNVVVSGTESDAHTWNLVFLQLLLEESGHRVHNLGPCVPATLLAQECARLRPDLLVLGTVNGHGTEDALTAIEQLRGPGAPVGMPVVIGGKLSTSDRGRRDAERLLSAGFDAVYSDDPAVIGEFTSFVRALAVGRP